MLLLIVGFVTCALSLLAVAVAIAHRTLADESRRQLARLSACLMRVLYVCALAAAFVAILGDLVHSLLVSWQMPAYENLREQLREMSIVALVCATWLTLIPMLLAALL